MNNDFDEDFVDDETINTENADTVVDGVASINESEEELDCTCGLRNTIENEKENIIADIKIAQSHLDKLLGKLELIEELLDE